jgi:hypothetical protein
MWHLVARQSDHDHVTELQASSAAAMDIEASTRPDALKPAALHILCERDVGLFSLIQQVIANVAFAMHERRVPIVFFGRRCSYWTPNGYRGRDTVWEYYFEPIVPEYPVRTIPEQIKRLIQERPPDSGSFGYFTHDGTFITSNFGLHPNFHGKALIIPHAFDDPSDELRRKASKLISRHVRVRREILEGGQKFYEQNMQRRPNIGVHLRGTDALVDRGRVAGRAYVDLDRYCGYIDDFLRSHPNAGIFVASDAESSVKEMREIYGDRVAATEAVRHQGGLLAGKGPTGKIMPAHLMVDADVAARSGEEAIIDYLLLSRCNALVHNGSSLARTVLLNVPDMPVLNAILPSYFGRKAFYLVRGVESAPRWVRQLPKRWRHRASVIRATVAGQPLLSWHRLLWRLWRERRENRSKGVRNC